MFCPIHSSFDLHFVQLWSKQHFDKTTCTREVSYVCSCYQAHYKVVCVMQSCVCDAQIVGFGDFTA